MSFNNCSKFTISGGNFTNANNVNNIRIVRRSAVPVVQRKGKKRTKWDDYHRVRIGDICIESSIITPSARRDADYYDVEAREQYRPRRDIDVRRKFGIARLRGEDKEDKFLCVTYEGSEAFKAFKQDFDKFSQIKHAFVAQVFGFNDNKRGIPALLFYDALIPLQRFIYDDHGRHLLLLYSYFSYQFSRMQMEIPEKAFLVAELWVDPRNGALQKGPCIEPSPDGYDLMSGTIESAIPNVHSTYLSIPALSDNDVVLEYLANTFTTQNVLQAISWPPRPFWEHLANELIAPVLSALSGTIYNRQCRRIVARWPGARECTIMSVDMNPASGNAMWKSQIITEDGLVRFTVTPTEMNKLQEIHLYYSLPWEKQGIQERSWLAQAHHIFSQLRIHADEWEDYAMLHSFHMIFTCNSPHKELNVPLDVYLFILPVPCSSDDQGIWRSWVEGERYFWSSDPFGREKVSDVELASSGIPSFTSTISFLGFTWTPSNYDIIQKLQVAKGIDPTTTDFAVAAGYPILEIIGDDDRFEDFEESSFDMLPPQAGRQGSDKHPVRASAFRLNHTSGTKGLRTPGAKTMRSNSSAPGAQGTTKHRARASTVQNLKSSTTADTKIIKSSSKVQTSSKQSRADSRNTQSLRTECKGSASGDVSRTSRPEPNECQPDAPERRSSPQADTRRVSLPAMRQTTSLAAASKDRRSGRDNGQPVRLGAKKAVWR